MYVYVLRSLSKNGIHYTGLTSDVNRRLEEHNQGFVARTRLLRPCELVHVEMVQNRQEARRFEKFFKSGYGREIIKEIEQSAPR